MESVGYRHKERRMRPPACYRPTPGAIQIGTRSIFVYQYTGSEWVLCYEDQVIPYKGAKTITVNDDETLHVLQYPME